MDSVVVKRSSAAPSCHGHGGIKIIREAIMVVIIAVSLGYLLLWIMTGTHGYRPWLLKMIENTKSTYFGRQGGTILIYTLPVLFLAILGCVYLHLGKKVSGDCMKRSNGKKHQLGLWKRPMIIKGLGIVSRIELAIFIMFIALLIWSFSGHTHTFFSLAARRALEKNDKIWEIKLERVGLTLGLVGNICLAFLFFPVTRSSSLLPILGLTSEASIKYHIWLGHITMFLFTAHGIVYILYWVVTHRFSEIIQWSAIHVSNVAGELSLLFGVVLWATTYSWIRQRMFELFFYTHQLYILFMLFYILHLGFSYSYTTLPGFYLFVVDRILRFLQSRQGVRLVSARVLPFDTLELNFSKSKALSYTPTSIIFINVPCISKLQWHPFTISSNSNLEPNNLSVIVKKEGSWTKKLYQMLSEPSKSVDYLNVSVEGPYGPASIHFLRHDKLVMVSGGSGIAPFISIIRELIFLRAKLKLKSSPPPPPQFLLISAFKYASDLTMLDLLLPISNKPSEKFSELELQVEAYVTREREPPTEKPSDLIRTIWFKPNAKDSPIFPTLGPNGWLWLGAIVSSSFVIFLLLMAVLTRFYIYPIDHNTNMIYSHSSQSMLNASLVFVSITLVATAGFLWNKKQNAMEEKMQIHQGMEGSSVGDRELELESPPHDQSLIKSTKVHYGGRPDLKKILLECKESSVGVLVCGPKSMRHEVAGICSSASAQNLNFESISFSW